MLLGRWSSDAFLRYIRKQVESFGSGVLSKIIVTSCFIHVSHSADLEDPRTSWALAVTSTGMLFSFGPKDWPPQSHPLVRLQRRLVPPKQDQVSHCLTGTACIYLWSVVTSSHDAVLRRRLLLPQTQLARCKGPYSQPIDCFAVLPRGPGWGSGANVLSCSPNLAHCAVQTSSMQQRVVNARTVRTSVILVMADSADLIVVCFFASISSVISFLAAISS